MRIPGDSIQDMEPKDFLRFFSYLPADLSPESCWLWQGTIDTNLRGRFQLKKKKWLASRISWGILYGDMDSTVLIMHSCDKPNCVNPFHLSPGTNQQNLQDARKRGQQVTTLTYEAAIFIKDSKIPETKLSSIFNCSLQNIKNIKAGKIWNY